MDLPDEINNVDLKMIGGLRQLCALSLNGQLYCWEPESKRMDDLVQK